MSSLFIRIYLDEDVNVLVADLLNARGFDAVTARDAGQLKASDAEQLAYAASQARALVTHNRTDFEELVQTYFASGQTHDGVIFAVRRSPQEIAQRLLGRVLKALRSPPAPLKKGGAEPRSGLKSPF